MHLLYLDDSGSVSNPKDKYFVLGGVSVFEAQCHWITQRLDEIAEDIDPANPHAVEFHASPIFAGREQPWKGMSKTDRVGVIKAVLGVLADSYDTARLFACAIHKKSFPSLDPVERAFEDLCSRFDLYLERIRASGERQRGLIILDRSSRETSLQKTALEFRVLGTRWGVIKNLADTPLFVDSKASRVVQMADHVAWSVRRRFELGDTSFFDIIVNKFDSENGKIHGLIHLQNYDPKCMCPACMSRR